MDRRRGSGRIGLPALAVTLSGLVLTLAWTSSALARTFTVTRADDPAPSACQPSDCSLREAAMAARDHAGGDTIDFSDGLTGKTVDVTAGEIRIRGPLGIIGPGASKLAVSAHGQSRIFHMTGAAVLISGITVKGGRESATPTGPTCPDSSAPAFTLGGGILEDRGDLMLNRVTVRDNTVTSASGGIIGGGGIANIDGTLALYRSRVTQNTVDGGAISGGGGILNCVGVVQLVRSTVSNSSVSSEAIGTGGGIANGLGAAHDTGRLRVTKSTIELNDVSSDAIPQGGGLSTSGGPVTVANSTISENSTTATGSATLADGGGIEIANATAKFTNSTIANNVATAQSAAGGGISVGGTGEEILLRSVTLADNIADGPDSRGGNLESSDSARVLNSIVAKGEAATGANCDGAVKSSTHDLESKDTCGFDGHGDLVNKSPRLRDLAPNGGPTRTMALKPGSPAINHASSRTSPRRDQRGLKRGRRPDIGAYEFGAER